MKVNFKKRKHDALRKLVKVDENNQEVGEVPIYVRLEEVADNVTQNGTLISEETFNQINWKDEAELILSNRKDNVLPTSLTDKTQIVGLSNGQVWVVPATSKGDSFMISQDSNQFIKEVITKYISGSGTQYENGISYKNGILDLKPAKEAKELSNGKYYGDRGVVSVTAANGLKIDDGNIKMNQGGSVLHDGEFKHGALQVIQGNGLKLKNGTIQLDVASNNTPGTVKVIQGNGLKYENGIIQLDAANSSNLGTVKVISGNGLKYDNGIIQLEMASSSNSGAMQSNHYYDLSIGRLSKNGMSVSNWNDIKDAGIYKSNNALNAPSIGIYVGIVYNYESNMIKQEITEMDSGVVFRRMYRNNAWTSWGLAQNNEVILFDGKRNLGNFEKINCGVNLFNEKYKKINIEICSINYYDDGNTSNESRNDYANASVKVMANNTNDSFFSNKFSFMTNIDEYKRYWIEGSIENQYVNLGAYSSPWNSTIKYTYGADFEIKITGIK